MGTELSIRCFFRMCAGQKSGRSNINAVLATIVFNCTDTAIVGTEVRHEMLPPAMKMLKMNGRSSGSLFSIVAESDLTS